MKRAERHHLKQDELVLGIDKASQWFLQNQRSVVNTTLVVAGAALLLGGLYVYRGRQAEAARGLLASALEQYHGSVAGSSGGSTAGGPTFASLEEKYRFARESFEIVASGYQSYDAGRQARYYVGLCDAGLKDFEAAERSLGEARSGDRDLLYYLASKALAAVKVERGDFPGAAEIYRTLVEDADNPLPKDLLLYELARSEERAGNLEQARLYYDRMVAEHPESQLRGDAITRSEVLELQSPSGTSGG